MENSLIFIKLLIMQEREIIDITRMQIVLYLKLKIKIFKKIIKNYI